MHIKLIKLYIVLKTRKELFKLVSLVFVNVTKKHVVFSSLSVQLFCLVPSL